MMTRTKLTKQDKYRHELIKGALHDNGKTFRSVAEKLERHENYVSNVSRGEYFVPGIALALARECGIPVEQLWPKEFPA